MTESILEGEETDENMRVLIFTGGNVKSCSGTGHTQVHAWRDVNYQDLMFPNDLKILASSELYMDLRKTTIVLSQVNRGK